MVALGGISMATKTLSSSTIRAVFLAAEDLRLAASILYQAYVDDPLFRTIFQVEKSGYESRLRAAIREELYTFWLAKQPMVGLFSEERLLAVVCVTHASEGFGAGRFWHWRLRMLLTAGFFSTSQLLNKEKLVASVVPYEDYHMVSFIAVQPNHQHVGLGHQLMAAIDNLVLANGTSEGAGVLVTVPTYESFFEDGGYQNVNQLNVNGIDGKIMFKHKDMMS